MGTGRTMRPWAKARLLRLSGRSRKAPIGGAGNLKRRSTSCQTRTQTTFRRSASHHLRNTSDKGTWYSAVPTRSYKQGDDTWKESDSLGFDDLLAMAELLRQAFSWIARQMQADSKARKARKEAHSSVD